ncbi:hypothetical protein ABLG96_18695 [Nakamurella sp. A5-74]|uniref:FTP domain-containing protein n=1 Tax=Nakamurella sp. A5-74 TaxID=3158264 RepID=A0AAU8DMK6_9ACTN
MIRTICRATGITGIAAGLVVAMSLPAGAAPVSAAQSMLTASSSAAAEAAVAQRISKQVEVGDLVTKAQAQRAWVASTRGDKRISVVRESAPAASTGSGSPYHLGNFRQSAVASAVVRYRASSNAGLPFGHLTEQRTFAYPDAATASRALTRDLNYLRALKVSPQWVEAEGLSVKLATGVGDDAYWRTVKGSPGLETELVFRQGNVVTIFSTWEYEVDTVQQTRTSTLTLAEELVQRQRTAHGSSAATAAVQLLGSDPIRTGKI